MTISSLIDTANEHERTAGRYRAEARRDAMSAADFYATAREMRLTARFAIVPNPADYERNADSYTRTADMYLRASFNCTEHARFYAKLASDYRNMAA